MSRGLRRFIKILLLVLILAVAAPFIMPWGKDGRPLLKLPTLSRPTLPDIEPSGWLPKGEDGQSDPVTVYRWRDENGHWQYSDSPPSDGRPYETRQVDPDTNIIQAFTAPPAKENLKPPPPEPAGEAMTPFSAYDPEQVQRLMDKARGVEELQRQRLETLQGL